MPKPRSAVADYAAYLLVRILVCILQGLSVEVGRKIMRGLAWLAYYLDRRHRQVALDNLRQAFPGTYSDAELHEMVRGVYRHFCEVLIEIVHLPRKVRVANWKDYLRIPEGWKFVDVLMSGRPVLFVTGHYGNWEMAGYMLAMFGFRSYAIARPLDNPHMDRFLREFRERTGQRVLAKKGELERMEQVLQSGGILCTLADQDAGQRGPFVDFFARPASTHKAIALLALEHRVTIVVTTAARRGDRLLDYELRVSDVIRPEEYDDNPAAVLAITRRFTTALERLVRLDPGQYFWLHRRWKHQPAKRGKHAA